MRPDAQEPQYRKGPGLLDAGAFVCELALLATLAVAGAGVGSTLGLRVVLSIGLPLLAAGVWGVWMAPMSSWRLRDPGRFLAQLVVFAAAGALMTLAGQAIWGIAVAIVSVLIFAATRWGPQAPAVQRSHTASGADR